MRFEGSVIRPDPETRGVWVKIEQPPQFSGRIARGRIGQDGTRGLLSLIDRLKKNSKVEGILGDTNTQFIPITSISLPEQKK